MFDLDDIVDDRRAAAQAVREKAAFLEAASHDMRQPFQAIQLYLDLLQPRLENPRNQAILHLLEESVRACRLVLDAQLDLALLDSGRVKPEPMDFCICGLMERLQRHLHPAAARKGLRLAVVPSSATVHADPRLLERMLKELGDNAVKFTPGGRVLIGARPEGPRLRVVVHDTGIGIPPEQLPHVFDDYVQVGNPERDRRNGLGLGLAVVRRLAPLTGCRVEARSHPGRGSRFSLLVPLA